MHGTYLFYCFRITVAFAIKVFGLADFWCGSFANLSDKITDCFHNLFCTLIFHCIFHCIFQGLFPPGQGATIGVDFMIKTVDVDGDKVKVSTFACY